MDKKRIIVGMSGASGAPIAVEFLQALRKYSEFEIHLIVSEGAGKTLACETDWSIEDVCNLADVVYDNNAIGASVASGSFKTNGMVIVPCSMKTVAGIAHGFSENLLLRAADVIIKERRRLILVTRESPLSTIHLKNMTELSMLGALIMPPMLTYYNKPQTIEDMTRHIVGKIMDQLDVEYPHYTRWE